MPISVSPLNYPGSTRAGPWQPRAHLICKHRQRLAWVLVLRGLQPQIKWDHKLVYSRAVTFSFYRKYWCKYFHLWGVSDNENFSNVLTNSLTRLYQQMKSNPPPAFLTVVSYFSDLFLINGIKWTYITSLLKQDHLNWDSFHQFSHLERLSLKTSYQEMKRPT